jgi:hypothetical protein
LRHVDRRRRGYIIHGLKLIGFAIDLRSTQTRYKQRTLWWFQDCNDSVVRSSTCLMNPVLDSTNQDLGPRGAALALAAAGTGGVCPIFGGSAAQRRRWCAQRSYCCRAAAGAGALTPWAAVAGGHGRGGAVYRAQAPPFRSRYAVPRAGVLAGQSRLDYSPACASALTHWHS